MLNKQYIKYNITLILIYFFSFLLWADDVYLKNGRVFQDAEVQNEGNQVKITLKGISSYYKKTDIVKIVSKKTNEQIFTEKLNAIDVNNARELMALANWCKTNLPSEYKKTKQKVYMIVLNEKLSKAGEDQNKKTEVAIWARDNRLPEDLWENILEQVFTEKYNSIAQDDINKLKELQSWCKQNYQKKYHDVLLQTYKIIVEQQITEAQQNPDKLYKIALWAKEKELPIATWQRILKQIVALQPNHEKARDDLGESLYNGKWIIKEEAQRLEKQNFELTMRNKGFVFYKNAWVLPQEAKWQEETEKAISERNTALEESQKKQLEITELQQKIEFALTEKTFADRRAEEAGIAVSKLQQDNEKLQNYRDQHEILKEVLEKIDSLTNQLKRELKNAPSGTDKNFIDDLEKIVKKIQIQLNK